MKRIYEVWLSLRGSTESYCLCQCESPQIAAEVVRALLSTGDNTLDPIILHMRTVAEAVA